MKTWNTPAIEELNVSCTEYGKAYATKVDEVRVDQNGNYWYSHSGNGTATPDGEVYVPGK